MRSWTGTRAQLDSMQVACRYCGAEVGEPCVGLDGAPLQAFPAHTVRTAAADQHASPLAWLADRNDPRVKTALRRECGICEAKPGDDCTHPWDSGQINRIVHQSRAESHIDKANKSELEESK